jgi:hypothetical protein
MTRLCAGTDAPWWFCRHRRRRCAAADFVDRARQRSAGSFALVAPLLLVLLGFVALVFLPSVLREMRLALPAGGGRWAAG